jgi:hypothetical protein
MFAISADNCASAINNCGSPHDRRGMALAVEPGARGRPAQWRAVRFLISEFKMWPDLYFASTEPALRDAILERLLMMQAHLDERAFSVQNPEIPQIEHPSVLH